MNGIELDPTRFAGCGLGKTPWPLTIEAVTYRHGADTALELGPGDGLRDMPAYGPIFRSIDLVDTQPSVQDSLCGLPPDLRDKIALFSLSFEQFAFTPDRYDFITAVDALPFTGKNFEPVFARMARSLKPAGVFSGTLWGTDHAFNVPGADDLKFCTREEIDRLFGQFRLENMDEYSGPRPTRTGRMVHWHSYNIIAVRR